MKWHFTQQMSQQSLHDLVMNNLRIYINVSRSFGTVSLLASPHTRSFWKTSLEKYPSWPFEPPSSNTARNTSENTGISALSLSTYLGCLQLPAENAPLSPSTDYDKARFSHEGVPSHTRIRQLKQLQQTAP